MSDLTKEEQLAIINAIKCLEALPEIRDNQKDICMKIEDLTCAIEQLVDELINIKMIMWSKK